MESRDPRLFRFQPEMQRRQRRLRQCQRPLRPRFRLAQDHEVVRVPHQPQTGGQQLIVERVQTQVSQQRAHHRALRNAQRRPRQVQAVPNRVVQPKPAQPERRLIRHQRGQPPEYNRPVHLIEKRVNVRVQQPRIPLAEPGVHPLDRQSHPAPPPVREAAIVELRLQQRFHIGGHGRLQYPVPHSSHQQRPPVGGPRVFLHLHPPQRPSPVRAVQDRLPQHAEVTVQILLKLPQRDTIGPSRPAIRAIVQERAPKRREREEGGGCGEHGASGASEGDCFTQLDCYTDINSECVENRLNLP